MSPRGAGSSAPGRRPAGTARSTMAALAAALVLGALLTAPGWSVPAGARPAREPVHLQVRQQDEPPDESPDAPADEPPATGPQLRLARQTTWVDPGAPVTVRVAVAGDPPAGGTVEATVFTATPSRSVFALQVEGLQLGTALADSGPLPLAGQAGRTAEARFATNGAPTFGAVDVSLDTSGVYPVEVRLRDRSGAIIDRLVTHVVRLPGPNSEAPPLDVAMVVPVDGGVGITPRGARRADPAGTRRLSTLLDAMNASDNLPLTVVPTPETVVTISESPRLARLRRAVAGRQVVSSQYVPIDLPAWVTAGLDDDVTRQTSAGEAALAANLVDRPDRRTAIADATLTPEALTRLEDLGADQLVVPSDALVPVDATAFPTTLAQPFGVLDSNGQVTRAVADDRALAAHVDESGDPVLDATHLLADLAVLWFDRPSQPRGVAVTLPRVWDPAPRFVETLFAGLNDASLLTPVTIDQLFERVPPATAGGADDPGGPPLVRTLAPQASPSLGLYPDALPLTRLTTEGFASFAGRQNPVVSSMQRRILVSGSSDLTRTQRRTYLETISRQINRAAAAVVAPRRGNVTLTSRAGRIPLNISNENLYDVTVRLRFESGKLTFPAGDTVIVHLPASTVTPLAVDVRSRSSGTFPLRVTITSPDEIVLVSRSRFTVRSTAVSGVGIVLSVGAGAFLALWWASHFRKVRRARKLVAAGDTQATTDGPDAESVEDL